MYTDIQTRFKILELYHSGKTQRFIANALNISPATVNKWINRTGSLETKKKTGRKRKTTAATDDRIFLMSQANPFMPTTEIIRLLQLPIRKHSVIRRLKSYGLQNYVPAKKEILNAEHIRKRLEYAEEYRDWTVDQWRKVIFADEKVFYTIGNGFNRVWRPQRQYRYDKKYISLKQYSGKTKISTWGCISATPGFHHIHNVLEGNFNKEKYKIVLNRYIVPLVTHADDLIYVHDQSPIHRADIIWELFEEKGVDVILLPPKGPDFNPIENVWAEMERLMRDRAFRGKYAVDELWELVEKTFYDMENTGYIKKLIDSMPERCRRVIEAKGRWTKY